MVEGVDGVAGGVLARGRKPPRQVLLPALRSRTPVVEASKLGVCRQGRSFFGGRDPKSKLRRPCT